MTYVAELNEPLYVVRRVGTDFYKVGQKAYSVPKLYKARTAGAIVTILNREAEDRGRPERWERVPVKLQIG